MLRRERVTIQILVINVHWWWITSKHRSWRRAQRPGLDEIPGRRVEAGDRPVLQGGREKEQPRPREKMTTSKISSGLGDGPAAAASPWQAGDEGFQGGKHQICPIYNLLHILYLQLQLHFPSLSFCYIFAANKNKWYKKKFTQVIQTTGIGQTFAVTLHKALAIGWYVIHTKR